MSAAAATILCVDDEPNILGSLRRLFRAGNWRVLTADGGERGLEILAAEPVDLVISDMRMPGMDGARFLGEVRKGWPDVARMLLTGHADIDSTVSAINRGQILRYIRKPWNDEEVLLAVRDALERRALERERARLEALVRARNEELRELNAGLERTVAERTRELREAFLTSIRVFAHVVELREGAQGGRSRRVSDLALRLARRLGLADADAQEAMLAALLHEIGTIGLPDALATRPIGKLDGEALAAWRRHCLTGAAVLTPLAPLHGAAGLIRALQENFDGSGGPDRLAGLAIPEGARILAVASEFDLARLGRLSGRPLAAREALALVESRAGSRYDPRVVAALRTVLDEMESERLPAERVLASARLEPGMVLSRDLAGPRGLLLLSADHALDARLIRQIREYERTEGARLAIHVRTEGETP